MFDQFTVPRIGGRLEPVDFQLEGQCRPDLVIDQNGIEWVRKKHASGMGDGIAGEVVGALLARVLSVPIPDFGYSSSPAAWLSKFVPFATPWSAARKHDVGDEDAFGRILALDAIILNTDRRDANILLSRVAPASLDDWRVWAIDHQGALIAAPYQFDRRMDEVLSTAALPTSVPVHRLRGGAMACADDAVQLTDFALKQICMEACALSKQSQAESTMFRILRHRCRRAPQFVGRYLDNLESR